MPDTPNVRVGQVWRDCNPRVKGRYLLVVWAPRKVTPMGYCIDTMTVAVAECLSGYSRKRSTLTKLGRAVTIMVRRMKPGASGYELVQDVPKSNDKE